MKKNVMALSIAAMIGGLGFAGAASAAVITGSGTAVSATEIAAGKMAPANANALTLAQGGVGHALIVPYFNAQNGNMTVLHVTNTDDKNGKVAKVRFRSAANSDDILDFQVFLSPGDVWTAAVTADANGLAQIVTGDNTCTVPALTPGVAQSFRTGNLPSFGDYATAAGQNALTREGYVEIFNMADITDTNAWTAAGVADAAGTAKSPLYTATKHVKGVAPCSVAGSAARTALDNLAIAAMDEATAAKAGLQTPTGGLAGDWYIMNVAQTTTFSGAAASIAATNAGVSARANFTHFPQTASPATGVDANTVTADALFRTNAVRDAAGVAVTTAVKSLLNEDVPDMSTPMFNAATTTAPLVQAADLLAQLAVKSVSNQYANDASITAKTDWVFSMPARRYNVVANYAAVAGSAVANNANAKYRLFTDLGTADSQVGDWFYSAAQATTAPNYAASVAAGAKAAGNTSVDSKGNICVYADGQKFWDREETTGTSGPTFSPGTSTSVQFCGEVSVMSFADAGTSVLGASVARSNVASGTYENGWARLDTTNATMGLPVLGSAFIKLTNPQASAGMSGTYGITWPHRTTK
jgi:hypothetical protein